MDPFISRLSKLVKASFIAPKFCPPAESSKLRLKGLFHESFLAKVFRDIPINDLHDDEFLKLLECLKIAVHVGKGEYFLPSALSLEPNPEESTFDTCSLPLVFSWGERILPHGFFFTVAVELLQESDGDYRFELRTDIAQWRGEIQVSEVDSKIPGVVKLINRTSWIQVCSSRHCPTIYKAVDVAVQKTVKRFEHVGMASPIVTVFCPLCETKDHYCLFSADKKDFTCSVNKSKTGSVTADMLQVISEETEKVILPQGQDREMQSTVPSSTTSSSTTAAGGRGPRRAPQLRDVYRLLKPKSYEWHTIGGHLGVDFCYREGLLRDGVMRTNENKLEAVLNKWIVSHCSDVSWDNLIQVLKDLEFTDIARDVTSFV